VNTTGEELKQGPQNTVHPDNHSIVRTIGQRWGIEEVQLCLYILKA